MLRYAMLIFLMCVKEVWYRYQSFLCQNPVLKYFQRNFWLLYQRIWREKNSHFFSGGETACFEKTLTRGQKTLTGTPPLTSNFFLPVQCIRKSLIFVGGFIIQGITKFTPSSRTTAGRLRVLTLKQDFLVIFSTLGRPSFNKIKINFLCKINKP